jgi:tetratricopeptide (TPR) repeat protein
MPPDNGLQKEIQQLEQRYADNSQGLVFAHLADAYRRAGEYAKAEGLLVHGLKTHPSYTSAYNVLGRVFLDSDRYADAQEQFSKVLELDPQNLIALRALGDLAARRGLVEDARVWYERMLQVDPRSEEASEGLRRLDAMGGEAGEPEAEEPAAAAVEAEPAAAAEEAEPDLAPLEAIGPSEPATQEVEAVAPEADIVMPEPEEMEAAVEEDLAPAAEEEPVVEGIRQELSLTAEEVAAFEAIVEELPPTPDEPAVETVADEAVLDLVGQEEAETQPVEGFIAEDGVRGFSLDVLPTEPETTESVSETEPSPDEPPLWDFDVAMDFAPSPESEASAAEDESELDLSFESAEETPAETVAETSAEEEGEQWGHPDPAEGPDLPSMDDWAPGFVVGELLEGQASEDLKPEDLLEGLDAEFTIDIPGEDVPEDEAVEEAGEAGAGEGMVTETMAELYATQGLYSDALAVYRQLAEASPDDENIKARISELTEIAEAETKPESEEEELARLMKLTDPTLDTGETVPVEEAASSEPEAAPSEPEPAVDEPELAPEPVAKDFAFDDEAPVAGFEQLDPFAASFEVLAAKPDQTEPPAPEEAPGPAADLVEPLEEVAVELDETEMEGEFSLDSILELETEPMAEPRADVESVLDLAPVDEVEAAVEGEPVPIEVIEAEPLPVEPVAPEPAEEEVEAVVEDEPVPIEVLEAEPVPDESDVPEVTMEEEAAEVVVEEVVGDVVDETIAEVIVTAEAAHELESQEAGEEIKAVDSIWELTDMEAKEVPEEEVAFEPLSDDGTAEIEAQIPGAEADTGAEIEPPTMEGYLADLLTFDAESLSKNRDSAVPEEASQPQAAPEPTGTEDLEQFQEWLRSLKR